MGITSRLDLIRVKDAFLPSCRVTRLRGFVYVGGTASDMDRRRRSSRLEVWRSIPERVVFGPHYRNIRKAFRIQHDESNSLLLGAPMRETTETQGFSWFRWALAAFLLAAIAGFYALGFSDYFSLQYLHEHLDLWKAQTNEHLPTALFLFFLVYLTITALSLPAAALLTLLAGALFDFWLGVAVVSLASTFGATLAFLSSRYLFREWVQRRFGNRLRALDEGVARDGAYYLFT